LLDRFAMPDEFPREVTEFINQHVHSLAQLEVLLMLHRDPGRIWTAEQMTNSLYLQRKMVEDLLADLVGRGFATENNGTFNYKPASDVAHGLIEQLAHLYQERRVTVISEIFAKSADSARAFADAFRLRGKE
jgi:DNA-binding MarR family transcriptional regulator